MEPTAIVTEISNRMYLHFDILIYVCHWIREREDLLSFISTCSDLYRTGVPTLLGFHYRITRKNLVAFYEFLTSKSPSSFLGLRSLNLYFPDDRIRPNEVTIITDILDHAKKLQNIDIYGRVIGSGASVYRALAALPDLHLLQLAMYGDFEARIPAALAQLRSPLVSLGFRLHGQDQDIVAALSHFRHTLERLNVSDIILHKAATTDFRYVNMTHLELVTVSNMQLSILIPAFPNLKHLTVKFADDFPDPEADDLRADNLRFQQEHPDQMWRLLSLTGDVASLYVVALQIVVHQVSITCLGFYGSRLAIGVLETVLAPLQPLSLSMDQLDEPVVEMGWLSNEVAQCHELARLDLELTFEDRGSIHENQKRLDVLFEQLASVSVSRPSLVFLSITLPVEPACLQPAPNAFADSLAMRVLATRALLAIATLKMSKFTIRSDLDAPDLCSYWTYEDGGKATRVPAENHAVTQFDLDKRTNALIEAHGRPS